MVNNILGTLFEDLYISSSIHFNIEVGRLKLLTAHPTITGTSISLKIMHTAIVYVYGILKEHALFALR